jgi:4-aminobutyrate aminotransferase-like enzyme
MSTTNAFESGRVALSEREQAMIARRQKHLGPAYRLFYEHPVHLVRGEGVWLYDADGARYLDVYNNVPSVGHCHPHVVDALSRQARQLNTHTRYLHDNVLDYAERLLAYLPRELGHVMFTCTGSEANDLAYRIARASTGGTGFIVTALAYHGVTQVIAELSPSLGTGTALAATTRTVPAPDAYRGAAGEVGATLAGNVRNAIADLHANGMRPAALIVDTIFSSDGVFADPPGFLKAAVEEVRAAGGIFIADEVQPGFGRTGSHMWGFERHGLVPDIVKMGKPMGAGYPIAGVAMKPALMASFANTRYFNTFGGSPVSAAVGLAVLEVIEREHLMDNARVIGELFRERLAALAGKHELIGDVRGAGLFIGVELVRNRETREPATEATARIVNGLRERRILISSSGPAANVLKIRPPLPFAEEHVELFVETLDRVLEDVGRVARAA